MRRKQKAIEDEAEARLKQAKQTSEVVDVQGNRVEDRLSLIEKLDRGWREVHRNNHLAQLFMEEWGKIR